MYALCPNIKRLVGVSASTSVVRIEYLDDYGNTIDQSGAPLASPTFTTAAAAFHTAAPVPAGTVAVLIINDGPGVFAYNTSATDAGVAVAAQVPTINSPRRLAPGDFAIEGAYR